MARRARNRLPRTGAALRHVLPAAAMFLAAAALPHPASLVLLLAGSSMALTAICFGFGFGRRGRYWQNLARRGAAHFVLSTAYTALTALLLAVPLRWLLETGSLEAALALSAACAAAVLLLWRSWPAFALPFLWDDAYPAEGERGSWLFAALRRSLAFARHLTGAHDLFPVSGLPVATGLFVLAAGALLLAGHGGLLEGPWRPGGVLAYGLVLVPLVHVLLIRRCLHALLADAHTRRLRGRRAATAEAPAPQPVAGDLDSTLRAALQAGQPDLALRALEAGADPEAAAPTGSRDQRSPLAIAVTLPDLRLLRALIARGAEVNRAHGGITPLVAATRDSHRGRPEAVLTLLANGADPRSADASGATALHHAARGSSVEIAALLLDAGASPDALDHDGHSPLGIACAAANWPLAEVLLQRGADPAPAAGQPALQLAAGAQGDDPAGIRLLLERRARPDHKGPLGRTALHVAALAGQPRCAAALLKAGANPNLADDRGTTPLMEAARAGAAATVTALCEAGADPDARDADGRSALLLACQARNAGEETVAALLAAGADRSLRDHEGRSALDLAAAAGRWPLVALLDPDYPRPGTITRPHEGDDAEHLLDALRFGHWGIAAAFAPSLRQWPQAGLASLFLKLTGPAEQPARRWLLSHGLAADARLDDGRSLLAHLLQGLPATATAAVDLVRAGAPLGGSGLLARLLQARQQGDSPALQRLTADVFARGGHWIGSGDARRSTLHLAAALGDVSLVQGLLDAGADPNARDRLGLTPLHLAVEAGTGTAMALVRALIAAGARPEIASATGETPLGLALARDPALADWLAWRTWPLPRRRLRESDLPAAATTGDTGAVLRLVELGFAVDSRDAQGATALIRAAGCGHAGLVVALLDAGADPTATADGGMHALAAATHAGREPVVRTLLHRGVAPDLPLAGGTTPLMLAAALGQAGVAAALLEGGADPNARDGSGTTPLHAAACHAFAGGPGAQAMLERLLAAGAHLETCNGLGQDALLLALGAGAAPGSGPAQPPLDALEWLLDAGASPHTCDQRGVSALHACAMHGLLQCTQRLKARGVRTDRVDAFGRTAAEVATLLGFHDVAAELGDAPPTVPGVRQTLRRPARAPQ